MKTILFGALLTIICIHGANAMDEMECDVTPGMVWESGACMMEGMGGETDSNCKSGEIWVENSNSCVNIDPCNYKDEKGEKVFERRYCKRIFKDIQVSNAQEAIRLVDLYAKNNGLSCKGEIKQKSKWFGQDFILCIGKDFAQFEFDDISEFVERYGYLSGICLVNGGSPKYYSAFVYCYGVSENVCLTMWKDLNYSSGGFFDTEYKPSYSSKSECIMQFRARNPKGY